MQVPAHFPWSQTNGHGAPLLLQTPDASQSSTWLPLHRVEPGAHVPLHAPSLQMYAHDAMSCQAPVPLQACRLFPLHL